MTVAPDILFIMCDSLAPHFMGAYGDGAGATPNLDGLAAKGTLFENAYASCPLCAPSRASLVTGRYASELGCFDNGSPFASEWPTIGHALGAVGYETAIIGKMHFVGHDQHHGFDHRIALETDYSKGYNPRLYKLAYDWTQPSARNPNSPELMGESYLDLERWRDYRLHHERDEIIHEAALAYLERDKPAPFFACVSYHAPHNPFWIPEKERNRFRGKGLDLPAIPKGAEAVHGLMDAWLNDFHYLPQVQERLMREDNLRWLYETFYGMLFDLDRRVGELLDALGNKLQDTVVVFASDHGDMMGHRGMVQKRSFYERSVRVPLLLSWPLRWPGGVRRAKPVSLLDLFPTLAELARAPLPDDLPGRSLLPSMRGEERENRTLYAEYHGEGVHAPCFMVRRGRYKYLYVHGFEERLYDLVADPGELENLAAASRETVLEFRRLLLESFEPEAIAKAALQSQHVRKFVYDCEVGKARRAASRSRR
jgi:choline-sulfatase